MRLTMKAEELSVPGLLMMLLLCLPLAGCGLKGSLYLPAPQTEAESDAVDAANAELDAEEVSVENPTRV